MRKALQVQC